MGLPTSLGTQEPLHSRRLGTTISSSPAPAAPCHTLSQAVTTLFSEHLRSTECDVLPSAQGTAHPQLCLA